MEPKLKVSLQKAMSCPILLSDTGSETLPMLEEKRLQVWENWRVGSMAKPGGELKYRRIQSQFIWDPLSETVVVVVVFLSERYFFWVGKVNNKNEGNKNTFLSQLQRSKQIDLPVCELLFHPGYRCLVFIGAQLDGYQRLKDISGGWEPTLVYILLIFPFLNCSHPAHNPTLSLSLM